MSDITWRTVLERWLNTQASLLSSPPPSSTNLLINDLDAISTLCKEYIGRTVRWMERDGTLQNGELANGAIPVRLTDVGMAKTFIALLEVRQGMDYLFSHCCRVEDTFLSLSMLRVSQQVA